MKRFIVLLSAVILCLTLAGCSGSQYKKATELYEQGNYAEAGEIFSKLGDYGAAHLKTIYGMGYKLEV